MPTIGFKCYFVTIQFPELKHWPNEYLRYNLKIVLF